MLKFKVKVTYIRHDESVLSSMEYKSLSHDAKTVMAGVLNIFHDVEILKVSVKFLEEK